MFRVSFSEASRFYRLTAGLVVPSNFWIGFRWVVILQAASRAMIRGHFLAVQRFLIMYVTLILLFVTRGGVRRFTF